jgi:hypothetical protein
MLLEISEQLKAQAPKGAVPDPFEATRQDGNR